MFDGFKEEYKRIKKGSTKPSRLAPLFPVIQAYEAAPSEKRLQDISDVMLDVMMVKKRGVKNVVKKYGRAFSALRYDIELERQILQSQREHRRTIDHKPASKPRPSRPPSGRGVREELKEEIEVKRPAARSPRRERPPLTPEQKRIRKQIARKVVKVAPKYQKLKELGYDMDAKGGFVPVEQKDEKGYKHLEAGYVLEALDPEHHAGAWLAKVWQDWENQKGILSFWDFVKKNERNPKYENCYLVKYIEEGELPNYKITIAKGELIKGKGLAARAPRFDTSNMTLFFHGYHHCWGIYVQDLFNNIYSGPALERDKITIGIDPESKQERVTDRKCQILHHSSFLGGAPTKCAGEWMVINGRLTSISMMTGHYKTKVEQLLGFLHHLILQGVDRRTITVKWPWPTEREFRYYNGFDFFSADDIQFLQEPKLGGVPLIEVEGPEKYYSYKPREEGVAPVIRRPKRSGKPELKPPYEGLPPEVCSECESYPQECTCGRCDECGKDDSNCRCAVCIGCRKTLDKCKCDLR
jgi:hypothetical protein